MKPEDTQQTDQIINLLEGQRKSSQSPQKPIFLWSRMFANKFVKYAVTAPRSSIRLMSGHKGTPAEMRADVNRWKQISVGESESSVLSMRYIQRN